jgi:hypothetical protein
MLNFVLQNWSESTINIKAFRAYGPRPRDRASLLDAAGILVANGWLRQIPSCRRDGRTWEIVRWPVVNPEIK